MIQLPNNCSCSGTSADPTKHTQDLLPVYPKNWDKANVSIKKDWYVYYYFRDPSQKLKFPKGKYVVAKNGINYLKTREERQEAIRIIMANHLKMLKEEGYNPITDKAVAPIIESHMDYEIDPEMPFLMALEKAKKRLTVSPGHFDNITSTLKYFSIAVKSLKYDQINISDIKRKHVRFALEHCAKLKDYWSNSLFNNYKRDLSELFNALIQTETIEYNPCDKINKKITERKTRKTLSPDERKKINKELRISNYRLWRLMHIFFHSGSRRSEMVLLQLENVNLSLQEFKILIKKGSKHTWVTKPIKDVVLPLWKEVIEEALKCDGITKQHYLFSRDLLPYSEPIRPEQITRRWQLWVKKKMSIEADFYSLKHSNTDEMAESMGIEMAALLNNHSVAIAKKHYALGEDKRNREKIKKISNVFA
jgi:site-specific recombinase XerC